MSETLTATTLRERYEAEKAQDQADAQRLIWLRDKAMFEGLSREERDERRDLEDVREDREPRLERLKRDADLAMEEVDIARVVEAWVPASAAMAAWYTDDFAVCVAALAACVERGKALHATLEAQTYDLPEAIRRRLEFPGVEEWLTRLASRLPDWLGQALLSLETLTVGDLQGALDVDGGTRELNPVVLERVQERRLA
jgi:hypothetical protein